MAIADGIHARSLLVTTLRCRDQPTSLIDRNLFIPPFAPTRALFRLLLVASAVIARALPFARQAETALDDSTKNKEIKIGIPTDFPPNGFAGADLAPKGLEVDTANYIAGKLGAKVELVLVTSANGIRYLQTKKR